MRVLQVLLASLVIFSLLSCAGGGDASAIKQVVKDFEKYFNAGNYDQVYDLLSKNVQKGLSKDELKQSMETLKSVAPDQKIEIKLEITGEPKIDGNSATLKVKATFMGETSESDSKLVKEDGKWKLDEALGGT